VKTLLFALLVTAAGAASTAAAELKLDIRDGKVTLDARDVTIRQILAEWGRVGQTRIVNIERVGSGPVTLQLSAVSERQALDIILRSLSGYLAAPRAAGSAGASAYDRILILAASSVTPTSRTQAPASSGRTPTGVQPRPAMPGFGSPELMLPEPDEPDDGADEQNGPPGRQLPGRPGGAVFGMPQPGTFSQPGMVAQPPSVGEPLDAVERSLWHGQAGSPDGVPQAARRSGRAAGHASAHPRSLAGTVPAFTNSPGR
jgi:hypothetical protein